MKTKNRSVINAFIFLVLFNCATSVLASEIMPEGFEDFAKEKKVRTKFVLNEQSSTELWAWLTFDSVRLDLSSKKDLELFLDDQYITSEAIKLITKSLMSGVENSSYCIGRKSDCVIDFNDKMSVQYVVLNDDETIRILVPPRMINSVKNRKKYVNTVHDTNALIMHHDLNVGYDSDSEFNSSYRNKATLGLSSGYLNSNVYLSNHSDSYLDEISYNYSNRNKKIRVGYLSENINKSWNGTSLLDTKENISSIGFEYGNTSELIYSNKDNSEKIFFTSPVTGRLRVTREGSDEVILEKNVSTGQNYISYSDLPKGMYSILLEVMSGNTKVFSRTERVYNNSGYHMDNNQLDYKFSVGYLSYQSISDKELETDYDTPTYINAKFAYQLMPNLLVGTEFFNTQKDYYSKIAANITLQNNVGMSGVYQHFDDNSEYGKIQLRLGRTNFRWEKYNGNINTDYTTLSNYFYGYESYKQFIASYNQELFEGNLYLNYNYYDSQSESLDYYTSSSYKKSYSSAMIGYSFLTYLNSTADINLTYLNNDRENANSEYQLSLLLSIPIGASSYNSYSSYMSKDFTSYTATVGHSHRFNDELSGSGEVSLSQYNEGEMSSSYLTSANGSINYNSETLVSDGFAYIDDSGSRSLYGSMSSTTIIDSNESGFDIYSTSKDADSYVVIDNNGNNINTDSSDFFTVANVQSNHELDGRFDVEKNNVIYPTDNYKEYSVTLDESSSDYSNKGKSTVSAASIPGTIIKLDIDMRKVDTYVSVFNDINGNAINSIECEGSGCLSVTEVSDGVFKLKLNNGYPFKFFSNGQRCFIPNIEKNTNNLGENFCMPRFDVVNEMPVAKLSNDFIYYLGEFSDKSFSRVFEGYIHDMNAELIKKKIGSRLFVFVKSVNTLDIASEIKLKEIGSYAIENKNSESFTNNY